MKWENGLPVSMTRILSIASQQGWLQERYWYTCQIVDRRLCPRRARQLRQIRREIRWGLSLVDECRLDRSRCEIGSGIFSDNTWGNFFALFSSCDRTDWSAPSRASFLFLVCKLESFTCEDRETRGEREAFSNCHLWNKANMNECFCYRTTKFSTKYQMCTCLHTYHYIALLVSCITYILGIIIIHGSILCTMRRYSHQRFIYKDILSRRMQIYELKEFRKNRVTTSESSESRGCVELRILLRE